MPQIIKRNGKRERFEAYKVQQAIEKAYHASQEEYNPLVYANVLDALKKEEYLPVEKVQDLIERELMRAGAFETARNFIKYRFLHKLQREQIAGVYQGNTWVDCKQTIEEYIGNTDWRIKANSNTTYSNAGLVNNTAGKVIANYWLDQVYTPEEGAAHRNGDYHIHDLDCLTGYCAGWSLRNLLNEGFNGVRSRVNSRPPRHFREALGQMANFLGILQSEWAGAQAFSSFDTYLSPYLFRDQLPYTAVKKALRNFVYNLNVPSRWGQSPFTNVTIDWTVPRDLREQPPFSGGAHIFENVQDEALLAKAKERGVDSLTSLTYKHFQPEMNIIQKAFYEVLTEGDSTGQPFTFPIPTVNITEDFDWEGENVPLLFENAAKIGSSYFQNFIGSQYKFDEIVKDRVVSYGILLNLNEAPTEESLATSSNDLSGYADTTLTASSHGVYGIFKDGKDSNLADGKTKVFGNPYLAINTTGEELDKYPVFTAADATGMSLADAMELANTKWEAISEGGKPALQEFFAKWLEKGAWDEAWAAQLTNINPA